MSATTSSVPKNCRRPPSCREHARTAAGLRPPIGRDLHQPRLFRHGTYLHHERLADRLQVRRDRVHLTVERHDDRRRNT